MCPPEEHENSLRDIFSKNLDLGKHAHLLRISTFVMLGACVLVSRRPSVLMLMVDVSQQIQFIEKKEEHSRSRHAKGVSVSADSSQSQARPIDSRTPSTSESLHYVSSRNYQLEKTVSHIGHALEVVIVKLQYMRATHFMRRYRFVRFKNLVHFSPSFAQHLQWYVWAFLSQ